MSKKRHKGFGPFLSPRYIRRLPPIEEERNPKSHNVEQKKSRKHIHGSKNSNRPTAKETAPTTSLPVFIDGRLAIKNYGNDVDSLVNAYLQLSNKRAINVLDPLTAGQCKCCAKINNENMKRAGLANSSRNVPIFNEDLSDDEISSYGSSDIPTFMPSMYRSKTATLNPQYARPKGFVSSDLPVGVFQRARPLAGGTLIPKPRYAVRFIEQAPILESATGTDSFGEGDFDESQYLTSMNKLHRTINNFT